MSSREFVSVINFNVMNEDIGRINQFGLLSKSTHYICKI